VFIKKWSGILYVVMVYLTFNEYIMMEQLPGPCSCSLLVVRIGQNEMSSEKLSRQHSS
jgi:hypothetical protein